MSRSLGYPQRYAPRHPRAKGDGVVYEHVLIAERALGRFLPDGAEVHHVDEDKQNNANRNLVICESRAYHRLLHVRARVVRAGGDPNAQRICSTCKRLRLFSEFYRRAGNISDGLQARCIECQKRLDAGRKRWRRR